MNLKSYFFEMEESMNTAQTFGEVQDVETTVLIDNRADRIVSSTEVVRRFIEKPLIAEHGFSVLIDLKSANTRVLWDAGLSANAALENMMSLEIDPSTIDKIVISHGHNDHTSGVTNVLKAMDLNPKPKEWERAASSEELRERTRASRIPLITHPGTFRERWNFPEDGKIYGPAPVPPQDEWRALGAEIILSEDPYQLGPGCWTTGGVPRLSFEESGRSSTMKYREGDTFYPDDIAEDQAIIINVKDKGLVVVSGCAHSGIVNTVNYAREISGINEIYAILGGFHLARSPEEEIQQTIDVIKGFKPTMIVPSHCTGFKALCQFATQMPDEFVLGLVGTKYLF